MNTVLRKKEKKNDFEKYFFKLMNNSVLEKPQKTFENKETIWYQNQIVTL